MQEDRARREEPWCTTWEEMKVLTRHQFVSPPRKPTRNKKKKEIEPAKNFSVPVQAAEDGEKTNSKPRTVSLEGGEDDVARLSSANSVGFSNILDVQFVLQEEKVPLATQEIKKEVLPAAVREDVSSDDVAHAIKPTVCMCGAMHGYGHGSIRACYSLYVCMQAMQVACVCEEKRIRMHTTRTKRLGIEPKGNRVEPGIKLGDFGWFGLHAPGVHILHAHGPYTGWCKLPAAKQLEKDMEPYTMHAPFPKPIGGCLHVKGNKKPKANHVLYVEMRFSGDQERTDQIKRQEIRVVVSWIGPTHDLLVSICFLLSLCALGWGPPAAVAANKINPKAFVSHVRELVSKM